MILLCVPSIRNSNNDAVVFAVVVVVVVVVVVGVAVVEICAAECAINRYGLNGGFVKVYYEFNASCLYIIIDYTLTMNFKISIICEKKFILKIGEKRWYMTSIMHPTISVL